MQKIASRNFRTFVHSVVGLNCAFYVIPHNMRFGATDKTFRCAVWDLDNDGNFWLERRNWMNCQLCIDRNAWGLKKNCIASLFPVIIGFSEAIIRTFFNKFIKSQTLLKYVCTSFPGWNIHDCGLRRVSPLYLGTRFALLCSSPTFFSSFVQFYPDVHSVFFTRTLYPTYEHLERWILYKLNVYFYEREGRRSVNILCVLFDNLFVPISHQKLEV